MLHTKLCGNPPPDLGEEGFRMVFTLCGHGGHLGHVTLMPQKNFRSPYPRRLYIKFDFDWSSGFGDV